MTFTHPGRVAVLALAIAAAWPQVAYSQAPSTALPAGDAVKAFDVPAGPLGAALDRFARTAGVNLSYDAALIAGVTTRGVSGNLAVSSALSTLLAGSGLEAVAQPGGGYSLRRAPPAVARPAPPAPATPAAAPARNTVLPTVTVTADALRNPTTEGSKDYTAPVNDTSTKLDLSPRETPQTLVVVPKQLMDDFNMNDLRRVLEFSPGVYVEAERNVKSYQYSVRGYGLQTQIDGVPTTVRPGDRGVISPDTITLDRVEIIQGASGLTTGAGTPGGTINLVRKMPARKFQAFVESEADSERSTRFVGDLSAPLNADGSVRARIVGLKDNKHYFVDHVRGYKDLLYGVVAADLGPWTTLSAGVEWQKYHGGGGAGYGDPTGHDGTDLKLPRSLNLGATWAKDERKANTSFLKLEQGLGPEWKLKAQLLRQYTDTNVLHSNPYFSVDPATGDGANIYAGLEGWKQKTWSADVFVNGPFELFGRKHQLAAGFGVSHSKAINDDFYEYDLGPINVYTHDPRDVPNPPPLSDPGWYIAGTGGTFTTRQPAAYASARFNLADPAHLILGARVSWYRQRSAGATVQKESSVFTPYAGFVYDVSKTTSLYASYSDIFQPHSLDTRTAAGAVLPPEVGSTYEAGVKGEYLGGKLNASFALFQLDQKNLAEVDSTVPFGTCGGVDCFRASGKVRTRGVDTGLAGTITPNWQVFGGYTYRSAKYAGGDMKGDPFQTRLPRHLFKLATTYRFANSGWSVGGNVRYQSRIYQEGDNFYIGVPYRIEQKGVAIVGAVVRYQINKSVQVAGLLDNVFDKKYYAAIGDPWAGNVYGEPRRFSLSLRADF